VGNGRTDEDGLERPGEPQVGEKAAAAEEEPRIFNTLDRPPDPPATAVLERTGGHSEIRYIRWLRPGRTSG
jgi:hypothetical protein